MSSADKARAFIEGRYAQADGDAGGMGGPSQARPGMGMMGDLPDGDLPSDGPSVDLAGTHDADLPSNSDAADAPNGDLPSDDSTADAVDTSDGDLPSDGPSVDAVGTPDGGTTQSNTGGKDSANYSSYEEMLEAYQSDIAEIQADDDHGNNIVELYDPLNYIGAESTSNPTWSKIIMGATEGDISLMNSLNLQLAWLNAGTDAVIEWQWDAGHVPSETLGDSFSLYLDQMYGEYAADGQLISKPEADTQTENGTAEEATGNNISNWVNCDEDGAVSFSLSDAAAYRTAKASKAMPAFDTIDYGQEDYVFGNAQKDARHWDAYLLKVFEEHADELSKLFNQ